MNKLKEILLKYKNKKFVVIEPGGNHGDRLIYMGMEKILKELNINYIILQYKETPLSLFRKLYLGFWKIFFKIIKVVINSKENLDVAIDKINNRLNELTIKVNNICVESSHVILIHGGGNMNDIWPFGVRLLKNLIKNNPNNIIIVGPQTYWFRETNFSKLFLNHKAEIHLFCRERYSYNLLSSMTFPENVHVHLSHDTALFLSKSIFHLRQGIYDLICFRRDRESKVFENKRDLYLLQKMGTKDLRKSQKSIFIGDISKFSKFKDFLELIEGSRVIYTDRLHVAILAAILGKKTFLYPNSYYKNRGVYEYSLYCYTNLEFVTSSEQIKKIVERLYNLNDKKERVKFKNQRVEHARD